MTLWILGAKGQVGRAVTKLARARGVAHTSFTHAELDISDEKGVAAAINADGTIINCAAFTAVDRAESEPELAHGVNADAAAGLARVAAARGLPLIHLSTDYVFDGTKTLPYVEEDIANPVSSYGRSKAEGEAAVRSLCPRHLIVRTSWVYAAEGSNFVRTVLRLASERRTLRVVADQRGGPTSADDLAEAILTIASTINEPGFTGWGTYHFSGAPATSWYDFARAILAGRKDTKITPIDTADYPTPARRPKNSVLDCSKIHARFGIGQPDWRTSLDRVLTEIAEKGSSQ
jgi:dTDP-4-dehydrorhamnose reductase